MGLVAELLVLHLIGRDWPHSKEKKARGLDDDGTGNNHHPPVPPQPKMRTVLPMLRHKVSPPFPLILYSVPACFQRGELQEGVKG